MEKYIEWEREIINYIIISMDISNGDAQALVEANSFKCNNGWCAGDDAETVANNIIK